MTWGIFHMNRIAIALLALFAGITLIGCSNATISGLGGESSRLASSSAKGSAIALASSSSIAVASSGSCSNFVSANSFTDCRDGQTYKTVVIGAQTWMAQNLNYSGDNGSGVRTYTKGWCYGVGGTDTTQHQDSSSCTKGYGRFYNWTDAMNISPIYQTKAATGVVISATVNNRGICPSGWHMPSQADWDSLAAFIRIDKSVTDGNEGMYIKAVINPDPTDWDSTYNAQDPYGFSALPAGFRNGNRDCSNLVYDACFWTTTENDASIANIRRLYNNSALLDWNIYSKTLGFSARCLRN